MRAAFVMLASISFHPGLTPLQIHKHGAWKAKAAGLGKEQTILFFVWFSNSWCSLGNGPFLLIASHTHHFLKQLGSQLLCAIADICLTSQLLLDGTVHVFCLKAHVTVFCLVGGECNGYPFEALLHSPSHAFWVAWITRPRFPWAKVSRTQLLHCQDLVPTARIQ